MIQGRKNVYTVGQVNTYIKNMFAQDFLLHRVCVKGEVSNCKYHTSGHIYFTLKDAAGTISGVMFAGNRRGLAFRMKEGDRVVVTGSIEVYERDGKYQLYAKEITLDGEGDLYLRYEALKHELEEMGMFAPEYKQPIPRYVGTGRDRDGIDWRGNPGYPKYRFEQKSLCAADPVSGIGAGRGGGGEHCKGNP